MEWWIKELYALEKEVREGYVDDNGDVSFHSTSDIAADLRDIAFGVKEEWEDIRSRVNRLAEEVNRKED